MEAGLKVEAPIINDISEVSLEPWERDISSEDEEEDNESQAAVAALLRWSDYLVSREKPGLGLQLASSRAKELCRYNRRAILLLMETSKLQESFAREIIKATRILSANEADQETIVLNSVTNVLQSSASSYNTLSKQLRQVHALSLQAFLITYGEATQNVLERFQLARQSITKVRQKAISARNAYVAVYKDSEKNLLEWKAAGQEEEKKTNDEHHQQQHQAMPKKIINKLTQLRTAEVGYRRLVHRENAIQKQSQRLEEMGLETLQLMEEDRLMIYANCFLKLFNALQKKDNEDCIGTDVVDTEQDKHSPAKRRSNTTRAVFQTVVEAANQSDGVMEAETLGIPEEIGELRDQVRQRAAARAQGVLQAISLGECLEQVATAACQFGKDLLNQVQRTENIALNSNSYKSIGTAMAASEDARVVALFNSFTKTLEAEGEVLMSLGEKIRSLKADILGPIIRYGTEVLKPAIERDNATWKQLCEAARSKSKAEEKYAEAVAQFVKVRDRCKSVDSDHATVSFANKHVSQSLASMFSILPNGGEHAMKVLDASTRASVAQLTLGDATQRETNAKQLLDSAVELTNLSVEAYKSCSGIMLTELQGKKEEGMVSLSDSLVTLISEVQSVRNKSLEENKDTRLPYGPQDVATSLGKWFEKAEKQVGYELSSDRQPTNNNMLQVQLQHSEIVDKALSSAEYTDGASHMDDTDVLIDDETDGDTNDNTDNNSILSSPERERTNSGSSLVLSPKNSEESPAGWLLRSLTMPEHTESLFGKMNFAMRPTRTQRKIAATDIETNIFATYFWPEDVNAAVIPRILASHSCSFRDGGQRFPFQYGRLFLSNSRLIFVGWTKKQLALKWTEIVSVEPVENKINSEQDSLVITCRRGSSEESSYMILSGLRTRDLALKVIQEIKQQATEVICAEVSPDIVSTPPVSPIKTLNEKPPDATLEKMQIILTRTLENVSIEKYHQIIWSETSEKPFYKHFLEQECFDVEIGNWVPENLTGPWCKETYQQQRLIKFKVQRKTHLYIGPPIANVTQRHRCRIEGDDRCVVEMTVEFEGIPYSDTFAVEIRWVATRIRESDLKIEVGVEVDFRKSTFLKSKIRSGTIEETIPVHKRLLDEVEMACVGELMTPEAEENEPVAKLAMEESKTLFGNETLKSVIDFVDVDTAKTIAAVLFLFTLLLIFRRIFSGVTVKGNASNLNVAEITAKIESMEAEMKAIHSTLDAILAVLKEQRQ